MIDSKQVITSAKFQLNIESSDMDAWFEKLVNEGVRHLDSLGIWRKHVKVREIKDGAVCLPEGFHKLIGVRIGSGDNCSKAVYVDLPFIQNCGCATTVETVGGEGIFEIQGDKLVFHNEVTETEATIAYFGLDEEDGILKIKDDYERALTAYVCWKYSLRNFTDFPQAIQQSYQLEWTAQKKWIKSIEVQDNFRMTRRQIAEVVHALLVDKVWEV